MRDIRPPVWLAVLVCIVALPLFSTPWLLAMVPAGEAGDMIRTLVWIYPFYMLLSAWLAWHAWSRRPDVTWILLIVMVLSTVAIYLLVSNPI